jgi:peroxiredoxin
VLYEVTRPPVDDRANFALRIAYLIDPDGTIRKAYEVSDVSGFADEVLADLQNLQLG